MKANKASARRSLLVLAAALFPTVPIAQAHILAESPEVFLPNSGPRGEAVYHKGDVVLRLPILWKNAARIGEPVTLAAAGKTLTLAAGTLLQAAAISASDRPGGWIIAFCTPQRHGERALEHGVGAVLFGGGSLTRQIAHNSASGQFCFFDPAAEGHFTEIRYFSSGQPDGTPAEKLAPVAYAKLTMFPVSMSGEDEIRISVSHVDSRKLTLILDIVQAGHGRVFSDITMDGVTSNKNVEIKLDKPFPQSMTYIGVEMDLVGRDPADNSVKIRFRQDSDQNKMLVVPEETKLRYCAYRVCR